MKKPPQSQERAFDRSKQQRQYEEFYHSPDFRKWWDSLTPEQQALARKEGYDAPITDSDQVSGMNNGERRDLSDDADASVAPALPSGETFADEIAVEFSLDTHVAAAIAAKVDTRSAAAIEAEHSERLNQVIGVLLRAENVKTAAAGLAYATGLANLNNFGPIRTYAPKHGLSPAAISKAQQHWQHVLNLRPGTNSKSRDQCAKYSAAQKEKHWRKKPFKAAKPRS